MSVIDEIKDRLDIVDVVSSYVQLKKAGRTYKGLCPFHNEKTPSFVVFPDSQNWHCFGACGTGGDIFSFVMKRENVDFGDALAILAAKAGVELQAPVGPGRGGGQPARTAAGHPDGCGGLLPLPAHQVGEGAIAREYLARRGLTPETWETWQLGYALDSWDALKNRLQGKGYRPEEVEEAGLVIRKEETGQLLRPVPRPADDPDPRWAGANDRLWGAHPARRPGASEPEVHELAANAAL